MYYEYGCWLIKPVSFIFDLFLRFFRVNLLRTHVININPGSAVTVRLWPTFTLNWVSVLVSIQLWRLFRLNSNKPKATMFVPILGRGAGKTFFFASVCVWIQNFVWALFGISTLRYHEIVIEMIASNWDRLFRFVLSVSSSVTWENVKMLTTNSGE